MLSFLTRKVTMYLSRRNCQTFFFDTIFIEYVLKILKYQKHVLNILYLYR